MSQFDLKTFADRIQAAAGRAEGLTVTISTTDLIVSKDGGYGVGRSESVPFAALFLRQDDPLGQALDRLGAGAPAG